MVSTLLAAGIRRLGHPSSNGISLRTLATASQESIRRTPLYDLHVELGGKMVPFAGYEMPVQYKDGIVKSHLHTREAGKASLFDVSHMGQIIIKGSDRVHFLEKLVVGDIAGLKPGEARLSLITNEKGGILDDTVITNADDHIYMVVNAGNKADDLELMFRALSEYDGDVELQYLGERALIALQGPGAASVLSRFVEIDLEEMPFMTGTYTKVGGVDCIVTRCGYTEEDGFEISIDSGNPIPLVKRILQEEEVLEAGLGARDSLRLEAGLCLHGHDITSETTPIEAGLAWTIGKRRREEGGFPGHSIIMDQLTNKTFERKRVGLAVNGAPAREGAEIFTADGAKKVGVVTSGTMSPCLKRPISMGYVAKGHLKSGTELAVSVRGKLNPCTVVKMPFVETRYYQGKK